MSISLIRFCLVAAITDLATSSLPSYIKPCGRFDPEINSCITDAIESLRTRLAEGIPELDAPAIEPLHLKQIRLSRGPLGARLDLNLTDLVVSGPSTFKIRDLDANIDNTTFTFGVNFEKLSFQGKYQIKAKILLLTLIGQGDLTGNFTGYDSDVILQAERITRNNKEYIIFNKMKFTIRIGKAKIHLDNLFGGDPLLGAASNAVLDANSRLLLDEIEPILETSLAELFKDVANRITGSFTFEELFPDNR